MSPWHVSAITCEASGIVGMISWKKSLDFLRGGKNHVFFIKQIFFQQVFSVEKLENVRGAQSFSGNNSALKNILNVRNFRFRFFNVLKICAINNIVPSTSNTHKNHRIIRWFF